ncbi:MAG TPA: response regulator transcription factor [Solirubrobacteraceae bacterium]
MTQARNGPREGDAPLRVIVADDDALVRRVVRDALQRAGIVVIAEAGGGREAIELTLYYKPDVVLMDLVMPGIDGIAATREIIAARPDTKVVMLSSSDDDELGLLSLRIGASGYLTKAMDVDSLPRALRAVGAGEVLVPRRLTGVLVDAVRRMREDGTGLRPVRSPLTAREWEVLDLLCQGLTTEDIADTLVLSAETVRSHVKSVLRKLGVSSRQEAIAAAQRLRSGMFSESTAAA